MQGSRMPVAALALILHINENFFLQWTQFACTTSLRGEKKNQLMSYYRWHDKKAHTLCHPSLQCKSAMLNASIWKQPWSKQIPNSGIRKIFEGFSYPQTLKKGEFTYHFNLQAGASLFIHSTQRISVMPGHWGPGPATKSCLCYFTTGPEGTPFLCLTTTLSQSLNRAPLTHSNSLLNGPRSNLPSSLLPENAFLSKILHCFPISERIWSKPLALFSLISPPFLSHLVIQSLNGSFLSHYFHLYSFVCNVFSPVPLPLFTSLAFY